MLAIATSRALVSTSSRGCRSRRIGASITVEASIAHTSGRVSTILGAIEARIARLAIARLCQCDFVTIGTLQAWLRHVINVEWVRVITLLAIVACRARDRVDGRTEAVMSNCAFCARSLAFSGLIGARRAWRGILVT